MGSPPHWTIGGGVVQFWTWPTTYVPTATTWSTSTEPPALPGATPAASRSACSTSSPYGPPSRPSRPRVRRTSPRRWRRDASGVPRRHVSIARRSGTGCHDEQDRDQLARGKALVEED